MQANHQGNSDAPAATAPWPAALVASRPATSALLAKWQARHIKSRMEQTDGAGGSATSAGTPAASATATDGGNGQQANGNGTNGTGSGAAGNASTASALFRCPISGVIMVDPVLMTDGYSYERSAAEAWVDSNNTSPKTKEILRNRDLVPNTALKAAIQEWRQQA